MNKPTKEAYIEYCRANARGIYVRHKNQEGKYEAVAFDTITPSEQMDYINRWYDPPNDDLPWMIKSPSGDQGTDG